MVERGCSGAVLAFVGMFEQCSALVEVLSGSLGLSRRCSGAARGCSASAGVVGLVRDCSELASIIRGRGRWGNGHCLRVFHDLCGIL